MDMRELLSFASAKGGEGAERKRPNKVILVMVAVAVLFLALSEFSAKDENKETNVADGFRVEEYVKEQESRLERTLKKIGGAGEVSVYISVGGGGEKVLARDNKSKTSKDEGASDKNKSSEESESVVVTAGGRNGEPYVTEEKTPEISGVLVVASGAANEKVKTEMYEAVRALYGIAPHRIKIAY